MTPQNPSRGPEWVQTLLHRCGGIRAHPGWLLSASVICRGQRTEGIPDGGGVLRTSPPFSRPVSPPNL